MATLQITKLVYNNDSLIVGTSAGVVVVVRVPDLESSLSKYSPEILALQSDINSDTQSNTGMTGGHVSHGGQTGGTFGSLGNSQNPHHAVNSQKSISKKANKRGRLRKHKKLVNLRAHPLSTGHIGPVRYLKLISAGDISVRESQSQLPDGRESTPSHFVTNSQGQIKSPEITTSRNQQLTALGNLGNYERGNLLLSFGDGFEVYYKEKGSYNWPRHGSCPNTKNHTSHTAANNWNSTYSPTASIINIEDQNNQSSSQVTASSPNISNHNFPTSKKSNSGSVKLAKNFDIPFVMAMNNHKNDRERPGVSTVPKQRNICEEHCYDGKCHVISYFLNDMAQREEDD